MTPTIAGRCPHCGGIKAPERLLPNPTRTDPLWAGVDLPVHFWLGGPLCAASVILGLVFAVDALLVGGIAAALLMVLAALGDFL